MIDPSELTMTDGFSISPQQARLWSIAKESNVYINQMVFKFESVLDIERLENALNLLISDHEILRTRFIRPVGLANPLQFVAGDGSLSLLIKDWRAKNIKDINNVIQQELALSRAETWNYEKGPLLRASLILLAEEQSIFVLEVASICVDRVAALLMIKLLGHYYISGALLDETPLQYADVAEEFNHRVGSEEAGVAKKVWADLTLNAAGQNRLKLEVAVENCYQPHVYHGECALNFPTLSQLSNRLRCQPASIFLACWQLLLQRHSGEEKLTINVALDGRVDNDLAELIGPLSRYLPIAIPVSADQKFASLVASNEEMLLKSIDWQEFYSYENLVKSSSAESGFIPFAFDFIESTPNLEFSETFISLVDSYYVSERHTLELRCYRESNRVRLELYFDKSRFSEASARLLIKQYSSLIKSVCANPEQELSRIKSISPFEQSLLTQLNFREHYPMSNVWEMFAKQVALQPQATAVIDSTDRVSYWQLAERAGQVAALLQTQGITTESRVALYVSRSADLVIGLLGILKAGAIYVPIDPDFHPHRINHILEDSGAEIILTQSTLEKELPVISLPTFNLDVDLEKASDSEDLTPAVSADQLAYLIYTSGSTGKPKGVGISHRALTNYVQSLEKVLQLSANAQCLSLTTIGADLGHTALFGAICTGRQLRILPSDAALDVELLAERLAIQPVDCLKIVPSHLEALLNVENPQRILPQECLVLGGDKSSPDLIKRVLTLNPNLRIVNHYGPTETTVGATTYSIDPKSFHQHSYIPIGNPLANYEVHVLDREGDPVAFGQPGELYLGGDGVARGYWNCADLTAERFVPNPFTHVAGSRLYRTGDRVFINSLGSLEFLGRFDHQVKIRGYRVELGEIESALAALPEVKNAVVVIERMNNQSERLGAYLLLENDKTFAEAEMKNVLKARLPDYMVPSVFMVLKFLPLNANGKVDRQALPVIDALGIKQQAYVGPRNNFERELTSLWESLLAVKRVGIHDNFFELGGHSLLVTQMISWIKNTFGATLALRSFFDGATVAEISESLDWSEKSGTVVEHVIERVDRSQPLKLSFGQERLWVTQQMAGQNALYNTPHTWDFRGTLNILVLERSLNKIIERHESLRTSYHRSDEGALQRIHPHVTFKFILEDFSRADFSDQDTIGSNAGLVARLRQLNSEGFELDKFPMYRAILFKLSSTRHLLWFNTHHINSDGWSVGVLQAELTESYSSYLQGVDPQLAPLSVQYADYAYWQRTMLNEEPWQSQLRYWRRQLANLPTMNLPLDRQRTQFQSHRGGTETFTIPKDSLDLLSALGNTEGATLFMSLLAIYSLLLSRYTKQEDVVIGTSIAGRSRQELQSLIGFFINQLVMRNDLSGDPSFRQLLGRVRQSTVAAFENQDVPFSKVVSELQSLRNPSLTPLFQVLFVLQEYPEVPINLPHLTVETWADNDYGAKFDLTLYMGRKDDVFSGTWVYNADLFDRAKIKQMSQHFVELLKQAVAQAELPLSQIEMRSETEIAQSSLDKEQRKKMKLNKLKKGSRRSAEIN